MTIGFYYGYHSPCLHDILQTCFHAPGAPMPPCFQASILSCSYASLGDSCSHDSLPILPCSVRPWFMLPCSNPPLLPWVLPCSHAHILPCSHASMLQCARAKWQSQGSALRSRNQLNLEFKSTQNETTLGVD